MLSDEACGRGCSGYIFDGNMSISGSLADRDDGGAFLSSASAGYSEWRLFLTIVAISAILFSICISYVRLRLTPYPAFVAVYDSVLMVTDLITSVILFGQFNILRSRALLLLASGYLFTSLITGVQLLTFPEVFTATGLLGAGPQTASWIYIFWHGGFPIAVIAYALSRGRRGGMIIQHRIAVVPAVTFAIGAAFACWFFATWGNEHVHALPPLIYKNGMGFTRWNGVFTVIDMILAVGGLVLLAARPRHTVLDLWLMIVMGYWLCDIALSSLLNSGRYDLGFYAGRLYGAFAANLVLAVLVLENSHLYRDLAITAGRLKERTTELLQTNETLHSEIADRKRTQEELHHAQTELAHVSRVTTMSELTASIAHEISQPITAAYNDAITAMRIFDRAPQDLEEVREMLGCVVDDTARAGDIINRIRDHIKKVSPRKGNFDINASIGEVITLLRSEVIRNGVSIKTNLAAQLSLVWGDRIQLQQVLLNLILNSIEAMSSMRDGPRDLLIATKGTEQNGVLVVVRDSGPGIDSKNLEHVFESFYTTKPSGVGIGLSICRSIIETHGGRLWTDVNESGGATFQFSLPPGTGVIALGAAELHRAPNEHN